MAIADEKQTMTTSFWHPFADMGAVSRSELVIERGEGMTSSTTEGRRYLDGTASLWYANLGHGRADVTRAVAAQMDRLAAYQTFGDFSNPPANELAARLAALAPMDDAKVFLASGGGDAIDTAAKIARRHWILQGQPERVHILSRTNGYHGTHGVRHLDRRDRGEHVQLGPAGPAHLGGRRSTRCPRSSRRSCASGPSASRRSSASR